MRASLHSSGQRIGPKLAALSAAANPDPQAICTRQAREQTERMKQAGAARASFTNIYSDRLKKCFIEIEAIGVSNAGGFYVNKSLTDAHGAEYAAYLAFSKRAKESWDVPPSFCEIYLSSGEQTECHSADEFDELVTAYIKR